MHVGHQNLTEEQTDRIGRSLLELHDIGRQFDSSSGLSSASSYNTLSDFVNEKDERLMLTKLLEANVFERRRGRLGHQGFLGLSADPFAAGEVDR